MIKALIIKSDPALVETFTNLLKWYFLRQCEIKVAPTLKGGLKLIKTFHPQYIFCDIPWPGYTSAEVIRLLPGTKQHFILSCPADDPVLEHFRYNGIDHLPLPLVEDDLEALTEKWTVLPLSTAHQLTLFGRLLEELDRKDNDNRQLVLTSKEGLFFMDVEDIIRLEGEEHSTWFYFTNRKPMISYLPVTAYEPVLQQRGFLSPHKKILINSRHVSSFTPKGTIILSDDFQLDISRRRKETILEALMKR